MTKKEFYEKFVANRQLGFANILLGLALVFLGTILEMIL